MVPVRLLPPSCARARVVLLSLALAARAVPAQSPAPARPARVTVANWILADRFSPSALRQVTYSSAVQPHWLGDTDSLWYHWRDHDGARFYLVVPAVGVKRPLFDRERLAAELAMVSRRPIDPKNLPFTTVTFLKHHRAFRFTVDSTRYEWNLATQTLTRLGRPPRDTIPKDEERDDRSTGGRGGGGGAFAQQDQDFRNYSPDSTVFVFARNHNLYLVEVGRPDTLQITTDGVKDYSFGFRDTTLSQIQQQQEEYQLQQQLVEGQGGQRTARSRDPRVRPNAVWSPDSKAFAISRLDQRQVSELYLVNALAEPRPALTAYRYAMPGEERVAQQEVYVYRRGERTVRPVNVRKWRDQRVMDLHWTTGSGTLRLVRRDRTQRQADVVEVDLGTGAVTTLLTESLENASIDPLPIRYVKRGGDFVWWSERTGWGQFYLYSHQGAYKRPLTSGAWHADAIAEVDTLRGVVWFTAMGREPGENVYYQHLYRINADGTGLTLLDPGNYTHSETISPTHRYAIDTYSRIDVPPRAVVRDAVTGRVVMALEEMDIARLRELGWKPPTTFVVKAADGVTDIYGNLWRPFDFDSTKRYPIIANVYPGPQTESITFPFSAANVPQQLAQLGFIVIQIGNRGGSPQRSLAYHRYGYYNLRDYALADKKAGIEQLAARHPWIDIERVGIYGHSGGGFLTAAALLQPPYNDFFKVGVASSGNHDNNIYNQNWSEWNHGLRVIPRADSARRGAAGRTAARPAGPDTTHDGTVAVARDTLTADDSVRFQIHVPTNVEIAPNLKGRLLLTTGDMDNNVHPGNTIRLVNALIKANKRFDFFAFPGKPHAYGDMQPYFTRLVLEYFAEHLLGDYYRGNAEIR